MFATDFLRGGKYSGRMLEPQRIQAELRKLWTDSGLDVDQVAARSGVNRATVYRLANVDQPYSPRLGTLLLILDALKESPAVFFRRIDDSPAVPAVESAEQAVARRIAEGWLQLNDESRAQVRSDVEFLLSLGPATRRNASAARLAAGSAVATTRTAGQKHKRAR